MVAAAADPLDATGSAAVRRAGEGAKAGLCVGAATGVADTVGAVAPAAMIDAAAASGGAAGAASDCALALAFRHIWASGVRLSPSVVWTFAGSLARCNISARTRDIPCALDKGCKMNSK
mmetsp:Transcript_52426/g.152407  ORF Transcript_52426/g.152407 Transcript_52426/m.152407 type:complete len:119 (+) Transcript_52426:914-1270(+)